MTAEAVLLVLAFCFCFYVAWNIGANDVGNAVGPAVGSGALTLRNAVILAAIFEFLGAFFFGSQVSETLESGIVNVDLFSNHKLDYVYGMLGSLLAAGAWLQVASFFGWPVSTTHSIVGAVIGFGLVYGGFGAIHWGELGSIFISWILSPLLGGSISYLIFMIMRKRIFYHPRPVIAAQQATPYLVFFFFAILSLIIFFQGLGNLDLKLNIFQAIGLASLVGAIASVISYGLIKRFVAVDDQPSRELEQLQAFLVLKKAERSLSRVEAFATEELSGRVKPLLDNIRTLTDEMKGHDIESPPSEYRKVEKIFVYLQLITACAMAFAHGSNDVANAIGPLAAVANILAGNNINDPHSVSIYFLLLGGIGIVIGLATWGWRVIETIGTKITDLTPSRGFAAGFGSAVTIILASKLGLPISTTHVVVGAVMGVGFARGIGALNLYTLRDIGISWIVTVPAGAVLSVVFFYGLKAIFTSGLFA